MKIYTACWHQYKGAGRIGISRGNPRGMAAGYRMYKTLAPTREILNECQEQADYRRRFFAEVLEPLDPQKVLKDLEDRSADGRAVLMCFEKAPLHDENWCHRTMVAEWIIDKTGIPVEEWSGAKESNPGQSALDV